MGGGGYFAYAYPKGVWSPAGGWWCYAPRGWQRNTAIAVASIALVSFVVARDAGTRTVRFVYLSCVCLVLVLLGSLRLVVVRCQWEVFSFFGVC